MYNVYSFQVGSCFFLNGLIWIQIRENLNDKEGQPASTSRLDDTFTLNKETL